MLNDYGLAIKGSFLKRWKKSWYSLSVDGYLRQFDSPDKFIAEKTLYIPNEVRSNLHLINIERIAKFSYFTFC